ncbi:fibronectin type III domain-containing protein [Streptomyces sp. NBC_00105]|uniref:fibronectin type III domain-containing protein n=1 Tax=Streptomyces sp. NBC_00105 TaxID=2903622 RepID=UPI00324361B5
MANKKKTPLSMGMDYTSDPEGFGGRTEWPPRTPAEVDVDRATWVPAYGSSQVPPAPIWSQSADPLDPGPVSGGWASDREIMICWRSGVGGAAGAGAYSGTDGLDLAGIVGHDVFMAEGEDPLPTTPTKKIGAFTNTIVDGLKADTVYRIAVAAFSTSGIGPKSAVLTVRTQTAAA